MAAKGVRKHRRNDDERQQTLLFDRADRLRLLEDATAHYELPGSTIRNFRNVTAVLKAIEFCSGVGNEHATDPGSHAYRETIAAKCHLSVRSVQRWLGVCEELGVLIVDRSPRRGGQGSNHYLIQWHRVRQFAMGRVAAPNVSDPGTAPTPCSSSVSEDHECKPASCSISLRKNGLAPGQDGLAPGQDGLAPGQDGLAPGQDGLAYNNDIYPPACPPESPSETSPSSETEVHSNAGCQAATTCGGGVIFKTGPLQRDETEFFENRPPDIVETECLEDCWQQEAEQKLLTIGIYSPGPVIESLERHCVPWELSDSLIAFWRSKPGAWSIAQLRFRLCNARPGQSVEDLWPPVSEDFRKRRERETRVETAVTARDEERERERRRLEEQAEIAELEAALGPTLDAMERAEVLELAEALRGSAYRRQLASIGWESRLTRPGVLKLLSQRGESAGVLSDDRPHCLLQRT